MDISLSEELTSLDEEVQRDSLLKEIETETNSNAPSDDQISFDINQYDSTSHADPLPTQEIFSEEDPKGRYRALFILSLATILGMAPWFSASAIITQLTALWDISPALSSLLTIVVQLGFVFGALVGYLFISQERLPPRLMFLLGSIGAALSNALIALFPSFPFVVVMRFFTGVFLAGVYPPGLKVMATWFRKERGKALGIMVGSITVGSALPYLVRGIGSIHWRVILLSTSAFTLSGGLAAFFLGSDGPFPFPTGKFKLKETLAVFQERGVIFSTMGYVGHMWELYACWSWFFVFFSDISTSENFLQSSHVNFSAFGTFLVISVGFFGCWTGGILSDRFGRTFTAAISLGISGTCCLLIGLTQQFPVVTFLIGLVWGFWVPADSAQFSTMLIEVLSNQSLVGTALSLQMAIGFLLTNCTIFLIPVLRDSLGWRWAFSFLAFGPLVGLLSMWRLRSFPESSRIAHGKK